MSRGSDNIFYFLNKNVKYLRKKNNLTQPELANKLNTSLSTIANFESGQFKLSLDLIDKLIHIFDININDLIYVDLEEQDKQES